MVGSVNSPTIESLANQLHELLMNQYTTEAAKDAPSPQNANVFAQYPQKGNRHPSGKKKKGNKGGGNQNKKEPTNDSDWGRKDKKRVNFHYNLCQGDYLTHQ